MFELSGFDHVQLGMPEHGEAQAREFYGGILQLTEVPKPHPLATRGGLWFINASTHIHLGIKTPFTPEKKGHPAILVKNMQELQERLTQAGIQFTIDTELPERFRLYTHDPFGNRLEFINYGDGFTQK